MADDATGRTRRIRHAHETSHLVYGHFGTATYDEERHRWRFLRKHPNYLGNGGTAPETGPLSTSTNRNKPSFQLLYEELHYSGSRKLGFADESSSKTKISGPKYILRQLPEVAASYSAIARHLAPPYHSILFRNGTEILCSARLALGYSNGPPEHGYQTNRSKIPVVAYAAGDTVQIRLWERKSLSSQNGFGMEGTFDISALSSSGGSSWKTSGEPVLQVCFSSNMRDRSIMAVRQTSSTTFFVPCLVSSSDMPRSAFDLSEDGILAAFTLHPNPVLTLPCSRTGGYAHAHVAFHPQNANMISVVDTHGNWSIWTLSGNRSRSTKILFHAQLQTSGKIFAWEFTRPPSNLNLYCDGWHRSVWLKRRDGDVSVLLAFNRQRAEVYNMARHSQDVVDMRLGPNSAGNWILDVHPCDIYPEICFILTSQRIMVVKASAANHPEDLASAMVVCSWAHFRSKGDRTLRLSTIELKNAVAVVLFSRLYARATSYFFEADVEGNIYSAQDPTEYPLPQGLNTSYDSVSDVVFLNAEIIHRETEDGADDELSSIFVKCLVCLDNGSLLEALYRPNFESTARQSANIPHVLRLPARRRGKRITTRRYVDPYDMDDFVAQDEEGTEQDALSSGKPGLPLHVHGMDSSCRNYVGWEEVLGYGSDSDQREDLVAAVREAGHHLSGSVAPIGLLGDFLSDTRIRDLESDSELLAALVDQKSRQKGVEIVKLSEDSSSTLLESYDHLMDKFVMPLTAEIPDRLRSNTEQTARRVALDMVSSSFICRPGPVLQAEGLPRSSTPHSMPPMTQSSVNMPSSQEMLPPTRYAEDLSRLSHLEKYTTFSKPKPPGLVSSEVSTILAHSPTDISVNPSEYSHHETELRLAMARDELRLETLDPRARRKAEKIIASQKRKLEKQRKMAQTVAQEQSMLPGLVMSSQLPIREVQSSQGWHGGLGGESQSPSQAGAADVPALNMTQPERGPFGMKNNSSLTRDKGKKKGKKVRKQGF